MRGAHVFFTSTLSAPRSEHSLKSSASTCHLCFVCVLSIHAVFIGFKRRIRTTDRVTRAGRIVNCTISHLSDTDLQLQRDIPCNLRNLLPRHQALRIEYGQKISDSLPHLGLRNALFLKCFRLNHNGSLGK